MKRAIAFGLVLLAQVLMALPGRAQPTEPVLLPPLSRSQSLYYKTHPDEWNAVLSQLPRRQSSQSMAAVPGLNPPTGPWQATATNAGGSQMSAPMLLTDGTVMVHDAQTSNWYRLAPDNTGSYVNGTWTQAASLPSVPSLYAPLFFSAAVLPDGRLIINGGEYNGKGSNSVTEVRTTLGAIFDPLANSWTSVAPPPGWQNIGDASNVVLPDGRYLLSECCTAQMAYLNPSTLTWTNAGTINKAGNDNNEEGWTLLPNGTILTVDANNTADLTHSEIYTPGTGTWTSAGSTIVQLPDTFANGSGSHEMGPHVLRPDGTVVAFGAFDATHGGVAHTAIYDTSNGTWSVGPDIPTISSQNYNLADAGAVLVPNGDILFAASPNLFKTPVHYFVFCGGFSVGCPKNSIIQASDAPNAANQTSFVINFLLLPNGQILTTDESSVVQIFTPPGAAQTSWKPVISSVPSTLAPGHTYSISGTQFNGLSQGAAYGDDVQAATNYPLVQITNNSTGHVFYARTFNHSTMTVAPGAAASTNMTIPANIELGASSLVVTANGVPSAISSVTISSTTTDTLTVTVNGSGSVSSAPAGISCPTTCSAGFTHATGVTLTATPASGWSFSGWTSSACSGTGTCAFTINGATSVTATFTQQPTLQVSGPAISASGVQGGPFSPSSFSYSLQSTSTNVNFSISNVPSWLSPSATSGTTPATINFSINTANANGLSPNTYSQNISFTNTTNGNGNTSVQATLAVTSSSGQSPLGQTFVSGTGADSGNCPRTAPCRTFAYAITQTIANGEISVLTTAGYGPLTINKSISIVNAGGVEAGITVASGGSAEGQPFGGNAITIAAGESDIIALRGLTIEGAQIGQNGIVVTSGGIVEIDNCVVRDFTGNGIEILTSGATEFRISNTIASGNGHDGILIEPQGSGTSAGAIDHVTASNNTNNGIAAAGNSTSGAVIVVTVTNSITSNNGNIGVLSYTGPSLSGVLARRTAANNNVIGFYQFGGSGFMQIAKSNANANGYGVVVNGGSVYSAGDNNINGNTTTDVSGSLTFFGTQ